jgi:uncharacterized protein (TIGR01777 family)
VTARTYRRRSRIEAPAEEVFCWHARSGALARLSPPWAPVRELERSGGIENGARAVLSVPVGPLRLRWVAEHRDYVEGRRFRDVQVAGPFSLWDHTHLFEPDGPAASWLEDRVTYAPPFGPVGSALAGPVVERMLERTFAYRHRVTAEDIATHRAYPATPLEILVTGASGLVGSALVAFLTTGGHRVVRLVRGTPSAGEAAVRWDPAAGTIDTAALEGLDAAVHLAGESIAGGRWSEARKARIRESRTRGTRLLAGALARLARPPRVLVSASAVGYYGDRGAETLDETSAPGRGFLAEVCRAWEAATAPAAERGVRVVHLRTGVVLSAAGGALARMLPPFRLGAGGPLGSGEQYVSWIALDDLLGVVLHALRTDALAGAVNAVAPQPVTNAVFSATLGRVLRRPAAIPLPAVAARLAFGEMADELLLAGARVEPARLRATGYRFRQADLEDALRHTLGR